MRTRLEQRSLALAAKGRAATAPITLDPQTATLTVRLQRPSSADASVGVTICVEIDGEVYRCSGRTRGGEIRDHRPGRDGARIADYALSYTLPHGFFATGGEARTEWAAMSTKRLGETAREAFRAWVEIEGTAAATLDVTLDADVEAAPRMDYHSSIAYQNATSAYEAAGGDGQLSLSFTAGAGTDRAAYVFGATSRDTRPTSASVTYAGNSPTQSPSNATNTYWRGVGGVFVDAQMGSGAQTVAFTSSGGGGTQYATYLGVVSVTGAHQTTPMGLSGVAGADSGTALSINVGTPASDSLVIDGWAWAQANATNPTIGASQTARVNLSQGAGLDRLVMSTQAGSAGGVMSWTKGHVDYEYVGAAVEIKAASGGTGGNRRRRLLIAT